MTKGRRERQCAKLFKGTNDDREVKEEEMKKEQEKEVRMLDREEFCMSVCYSK